eukprot:scaffold393_cov104-Isochrysis_galbana.AAC.8
MGGVAAAGLPLAAGASGPGFTAGFTPAGRGRLNGRSGARKSGIGTPNRFPGNFPNRPFSGTPSVLFLVRDASSAATKRRPPTTNAPIATAVNVKAAAPAARATGLSGGDAGATGAGGGREGSGASVANGAGGGGGGDSSAGTANGAGAGGAGGAGAGVSPLPSAVSAGGVAGSVGSATPPYSSLRVGSGCTIGARVLGWAAGLPARLAATSRFMEAICSLPSPPARPSSTCASTCALSAPTSACFASLQRSGPAPSASVWPAATSALEEASRALSAASRMDCGGRGAWMCVCECVRACACVYDGAALRCGSCSARLPAARCAPPRPSPVYSEQARAFSFPPAAPPPAPRTTRRRPRRNWTRPLRPVGLRPPPAAPAPAPPWRQQETPPVWRRRGWRSRGLIGSRGGGAQPPEGRLDAGEEHSSIASAKGGVSPNPNEGNC